MKNTLILLSALTLFFGCRKENSQSIKSGAVNTASAFTDTIKIPINDLGTRTYMGFMGGLYPGGVNLPSGKYAKDLKNFASRITPLDSTGKIDSAKGNILFISIGGSTCGHNMTALKTKTMGNPLTNPFLKLVNCANGSGSASMNSIIDPNDPYWDHVDVVLKGSHVSYKQVQVIYLESEDSTNTQAFPGRPYLVRDEIEAALRLFMIKFKRLKLVYVLGRTTTFGNKIPPNAEPSPYYNGWADKFAIGDQINGVPGTEYKGVNAVAPMITWGWYQWADGTTTPRQDGFVWLRSETDDGMHATDAGQDTLSTRFQNFLLSDPCASIWYAKKTPGNSITPGLSNSALIKFNQ